MPHYFLISPSFPFWKTSLILYYRIWISELRVCSSKYQNPSYFQGDSFLTISRRNTFPLLVPTKTIRKQFLIVSKSKFQESFLAPLPLTAHQSFSVCWRDEERKISIKRCEGEGWNLFYQDGDRCLDTSRGTWGKKFHLWLEPTLDLSHCWSQSDWRSLRGIEIVEGWKTFAIGIIIDTALDGTMF